MISSPGCLCLTDGALGAELDTVLDHLAPRDAEIVLLQIGTPQSRHLLHWSAHTPLPVVSEPTKPARGRPPRPERTTDPPRSVPLVWGKPAGGGLEGPSVRTKNHGDYISSQRCGDDAAHSCIGMLISK